MNKCCGHEIDAIIKFMKGLLHKSISFEMALVQLELLLELRGRRISSENDSKLRPGDFFDGRGILNKNQNYRR